MPQASRRRRCRRAIDTPSHRHDAEMLFAFKAAHRMKLRPGPAHALHHESDFINGRIELADLCKPRSEHGNDNQGSFGGWSRTLLRHHESAATGLLLER